MKLIYYAPTNMSLKNNLPLISAPRIRTRRIYEALTEKSDLFVICGNYDERREAIQRFHAQHKFSDFDGMYMESVNWPLRMSDYRFLSQVSKSLPATIFYGD